MIDIFCKYDKKHRCMEEKKKYHYLRDGKKVVLTESDLKMMVKNCVRKVLSESEQRYNVGKIGKWNRIPSNGYEFHKIPGKGTCVGIMMYVDSTSEMEIPPTYCLFRRGGQRKIFLCNNRCLTKRWP